MAMTIEVKLYGILRRYRPANIPANGHKPFEMEYAEGMSIDQVREQLGIDPGLVAATAVNGETAEAGTRIADGDKISFFPPAAGG